MIMQWKDTHGAIWFEYNAYLLRHLQAGLQLAHTVTQYLANSKPVADSRNPEAMLFARDTREYIFIFLTFHKSAANDSLLGLFSSSDILLLVRMKGFVTLENSIHHLHERYYPATLTKTHYCPIISQSI